MKQAHPVAGWACFVSAGYLLELAVALGLSAFVELGFALVELGLGAEVELGLADVELDLGADVELGLGADVELGFGAVVDRDVAWVRRGAAACTELDGATYAARPVLGYIVTVEPLAALLPEDGEVNAIRPANIRESCADPSCTLNPADSSIDFAFSGL